MSRCHVTARIVAQPGAADKLLAAMLDMVPLARAESGCLGYDLYQSMDSSDTFLFCEVWADRQALEAHVASAHMLAYHQLVHDWVAEQSVEICPEDEPA